VSLGQKRLGKVCIFCGNKPVKKNREHVLPRWLTSMTGGGDKILRLQSSTFFRRQSLNSFAFPSCSACNEAFGRLEETVKPVVEALLQKLPLAAANFSVLLDWLDKVRIGLWLGWSYVDKRSVRVQPNYYIWRRTQKKDRSVLISMSTSSTPMLQFYLPGPLFGVQPSSFSLFINGLCFTNLSCEHLVARRLGFPHPQSREIVDEESGLARFTLTQGLSRCLVPVIRRSLSLSGTFIHQPIFKMEIEQQRSLYDNDYVRKNSLLWEAGLGRCFIEREGSCRAYDADASFAWLPEPQYDVATWLKEAAIAAHELEHYCFDTTMGKLSKQEKQRCEDIFRLRTLSGTQLKDLKPRGRFEFWLPPPLTP